MFCAPPVSHSLPTKCLSFPVMQHALSHPSELPEYAVRLQVLCSISNATHNVHNKETGTSTWTSATRRFPILLRTTRTTSTERVADPVSLRSLSN